MNLRAEFLLLLFLSTRNLDAQFLDFLDYFIEGNCFVTAFGCDKKGLVTLSEKLSSRGVSHKSITKTESFLWRRNIIYQKNWFLVDLNCADSLNLLRQANENNLFSFPHHWLLSYNADKVIEPKAVFSNLSILIDSDFTLCRREKNGSFFTFKKLYKKSLNAERFEVEHIGSWTAETGFRKSQVEDLGEFRNRQNMGIVLRACIVVTHSDTLKHISDRRDKHIDSITKVNYSLIMLLASIFNVTLNISVTNTWGYKDNASNWNGMMGELTKNEADIGGTSLFLIKERIDLIDYIAMISPTKSKFVFRQPKLSYVSNVYTLPFDNKVWICTVFLIIIMLGALYALMKWEDLKTIKKFGKLETTPDVFFVTFGAMCQQGAAVLPHSSPGRIATLVLFLSLMFLYVSYSANIVALLQTSSKSIQSLEDLLKSRISVGVDDTVFNRYYFKTADEPIRKLLYQKKVAPPGKRPNFLYIEDGVRRMREGLFAFHMETGSGYKLVSETFKEDEKCDLQEIAFLQVVDPWLAIQKNSSFKEKFKIGFRLLQESGIQQRENMLIYTRRPICTSKSSTFFSVGIVDCYPALALLAGGLISCLCMFLGEFYVYYMVTKTHNRKK